MQNNNYNYHGTRFIISAPNIRYLLKYKGIEVAFAGRSNAGKSSALNALVNQKNLARTSKIPGCTKLINLFKIKEGYHLVDLPGYGYAQVPKNIKRKWQCTLNEYLKVRHCLRGLVVLMDIRHPLQSIDQKIIQSTINIKMPLLILLTKADKLSSIACQRQLHMVRKAVFPFSRDIQVEIFSSKNKVGIDKLKYNLNLWFSQ